MNDTIIGIIIPVYKVEKYICRCIDSVLSQSFRDFKLILVDDGSPDDCPKICDNYKLKDNRIEVIHKKNGGLSSARNAGLDYLFNHSIGDYITFIDSDDYVSPYYLEILYSSLQNNKAAISMCLIKRTNLSGIEEYMPTKNYDVEIFGSHSFFARNSRLAKKGEYYSVSCGKLFDKTIFNKIRFKNGIFHEDEDISNYIFKKQFVIVKVDLELYFYYTNPTSITHNNDIHIQKSIDRYVIYIKRKRILRKLRLIEDELFYIEECQHNLGYLMHYKKNIGKFRLIILALKNISLSTRKMYRKSNTIVFKRIIKLLISK